jgi:hypothetical protein
MTWQSSEEMTKALVKPTVQKKAPVQAYCGYSIRNVLVPNVLVPKGFSSKVFSTS